MDNIEGDAHMIISVILYSMVLVLGLLVIVGIVVSKIVVFRENFRWTSKIATKCQKSIPHVEIDTAWEIREIRGLFSRAIITKLGLNLKVWILCKITIGFTLWDWFDLETCLATCNLDQKHVNELTLSRWGLTTLVNLPGLSSTWFLYNVLKWT